MRSSTITTSLNKNIGSGQLRYKQYDSGQKIIIRVIANGKEFSLDGYTAKALLKLPTKPLEKRDCSIENNTIILELDDVLLNETGNVFFEIKLHKEGVTTTTFRMQYFVEESFDQNGAVNTEINWDILQQLVNFTLTVEGKNVYFNTVNNAENPFELDEYGNLSYVIN